MAGDHKCPVCSSTFTRPQHVARHMRSHTGDRPYKCQHCGDQFARSDLLSRHVNKCHASEKPPTTTAPNNRRKGTAAASRAATSKQACDQCVTSSLPCDGCNPCSKCVQRKCRCTYVKFHRQTAPSGPGHPPPNAIPQASQRSSIALGGRVPDEFLLGPAPPAGALGNVVPNLYMSPDYSLPNAMYSANPYDPRQSPGLSLATARESIDTSPDMMARYRAQAALLSRAGVMPNGTINAPGLAGPGLYSDPVQHLGRYSGAVGLDEYGRPFPGGGGSAALAAHPPSHGSAPNFSNVQPQSTQPYGSSAGGGVPFPQSHTGSSPTHVPANTHTHQRRSDELSDDFSDSTHSVPSSANSSSVNLVMDHHDQHGHSRMYAVSSGYHGQEQQGKKDDAGEGGFSSAFGLMSLDDPAVLAGLAHDSEPFFSALNHHFQQGHNAHSANSSSTSLQSDPSLAESQTSNSSVASSSHDSSTASGLSLATPTPELIASLKNGGLLSAGGREMLDSKELRDFWKQYMRTPLTGPASSSTLFPLQTPTGPGHQLGSTSPSGSRPSPSRRHSRVASLPSMKTPPILQGNYGTLGSAHGSVQEITSFAPSSSFSLSFQPKIKNRGQQAQGQSQETDGRGPKIQYSSVRTTLHGNAEDLKSYEQAVLARKAPTTLNLVPKRRGTLPPGSTSPTKAGGSVSAGSSPIVGGASTSVPHYPGLVGSLSQATNSGVNGPSAYGGKIGDMLNRGGSGGSPAGDNRPGSSSTSSSLADAFGSSAHAYQAQQAAYHSQSSSDSSPGPRESSVGAESDSGVSSSSPSMSYRPSFKRLASQTLGPPVTKRALLGPAGWDDRETSEEVLEEEEDNDMRGSAPRYGYGSLRRFSLPSGHTSGAVISSGMTLPPIRTASEHAETAAHA